MDIYELPECHLRSHLFTVRLWVEEFDDDQAEVRVQVKHVLSGETRYFRDWSLLMTYLLTKLRENSFDPIADDQRTSN